jgi:hypothetical protein
VTKQFVAWNGGDAVYTLNLDTRVWTKHPSAPTNTVIPGPQAVAGTYGRWRYVPSKNLFILANTIDEDVYFYKLSGEAMLLPPSPPRGSRIALPLKQWVALSLPARYRGGAKHITGTWDPDNGRLYFTGGDYAGEAPFTGFTDSYRQETYSLSLAERFADKANPNVGWRLEYPYCGPAGQVQPKHPDYVGWTWDSKRHLFWMVPGTMETSDLNCPGETTAFASDPGFRIQRIMTFDPVTQRWADVADAGLSGIVPETWGTVYDPQTDTLIRFNWHGGAGGQVGVYDIATRAWTFRTLGLNALGQEIRINDGPVAADLVGRAIYAIDAFAGRLHRHRMDTGSLEDLGVIPGGPLTNTWTQPAIVWDSVNQVVLWHRYFGLDADGNPVSPAGFYAYHPDSKRWETLSLGTDLTGVTASGLSMTFDSGQNAVVLIPRVPSGTPPALYLYVYRYGAGASTPPPPPSAERGRARPRPVPRSQTTRTSSVTG